MGASLIAFVLVYFAVFGVGVWITVRAILPVPQGPAGFGPDFRGGPCVVDDLIKLRQIGHGNTCASFAIAASTSA